MKTLLIDNYDSFSRILFQYLWEVNGTEPIFIHNDACSLAQIKQLHFDNILISPGPGHPGVDADFGICREVIENFLDVPILGICLGHQGLGLSVGAKIVHAPKVMHGKLSKIIHSGQGLFQNLPNHFSAIRYHSLVIEKKLPPEKMVITATAEDDHQIMGIQIKDRPAYGLQFHPESIGSEYGKLFLENFRKITAETIHPKNGLNRLSSAERPTDMGPAAINVTSVKTESLANPHVLHLPWRDPENVFQLLFQKNDSSLPVFWLDSLLAPVEGESLTSYMGMGVTLLELGNENSRLKRFQPAGNNFVITKEFVGSPLDFLNSNLNATVTNTLPGPFSGGWVGYLGYELQGQFLKPDRILAFNHTDQTVTAFLPNDYTSLESDAVHDKNLKYWFENLPSLWEIIPISPRVLEFDQSLVHSPLDLKLPWHFFIPKNLYLQSIQKLKTDIQNGETYEACLTNEVSVKANVDPFLVYQILRRTNPAPYAAFLQFPKRTILSASPERFLKMDASQFISSRPIKGTRRRGQTEIEDAALIHELENNPKDQSENLMIVDLVRHDLSTVCELGSVQVTELMKVEKHPTVLQLVSTVVGKLAKGKNAIDLIRACFPGGSMTGAPKIRTMQLLAREENRERGVFSGGLGYIGSNGCVDLGMVIRTLVYQNEEYSIGCGGAILAESDPLAEWDEILLKAFASQRAVEWALSYVNVSAQLMNTDADLDREESRG